MKPVILGSRGSPLALAQTRLIMAELKRAWPGRNFEIHIIKTEGDQLADKPDDVQVELGKGLFTGELEKALIKGEIDLAVHSLKDLPVAMPNELMLASIPKRADARDVLITKMSEPKEELPENWVTASGSLRRVILGPELRYGAVVATGSPRRQAQLKHLRTDLVTVPVRGNIGTRLKKFREHDDWSALILAAAGLERLKPDVSGLTVTPMSYSQMLPAPGQGALGIQVRTENSADVRALIRPLNDSATFAAVTAERMFLQALGGGCGEPIAAHAEVNRDGLLQIEGIAWLIGETEPRRGKLARRLDQAESLGVDLAVELSR
jgi:hydroxymethylbilane synthase